MNDVIFLSFGMSVTCLTIRTSAIMHCFNCRSYIVPSGMGI